MIHNTSVVNTRKTTLVQLLAEMASTVDFWTVDFNPAKCNVMRIERPIHPLKKVHDSLYQRDVRTCVRLVNIRISFRNLVNGVLESTTYVRLILQYAAPAYWHQSLMKHENKLIIDAIQAMSTTHKILNGINTG